MLLIVVQLEDRRVNKELSKRHLALTNDKCHLMAASAAVSEIPHPWARDTRLAPCSLSDVMDEELASELQKEEEETVYHHETDTTDVSFDTTSEADTSNDALVAQLLQLEFDREHDRHLKAQEKHVNGNSKVSISLANYRSVHPSLVDEDDEWEVEEVEVKSVPKAPTSSNRRGRRRHKPGTPTKHDPEVCGRRNIERIESFPPHFSAGDVTSPQDDFRLPNHVYTVLKQHSIKEERQSQRIHEKKEHSTQNVSLDPNTRLVLFKFVNSGMLTEVNGCISTGKEASVFHAVGGSCEDMEIPGECAIKVFKTTLNEFKTRDKYVKGDHRFKSQFSRQNPRKTVRLWAEKEARNLLRIEKVGIPCPRLVKRRDHVIVMSFIGQDRQPAPQLKYANLKGRDMSEAYSQCVDMMKQLYEGCKLVHADLSEFNLLWHRDTLYVIDVSQAVDPSHPSALSFLLRDCRNVVKFFQTEGVEDVMPVHELFNYVTGLEMEAGGEEALVCQAKLFNRRQARIEQQREMPRCDDEVGNEGFCT